MKDIQTISSGYQKGSFELLPESIDRFYACNYFCDEIQKYSTLKDEIKAKWYLRCTLSGFQSVLDSLDGEIKKKVGNNLWKGSKQKEAMNQDVLVKMLTRVRNFAVHSARISGKIKNYSITVLSDTGDRIEDVRSLFFDELNKKENFRDESKVVQEEIEWFNRQSSAWPANLLIREGLYKASTYIHFFCAENRIV